MFLTTDASASAPSVKHAAGLPEPPTLLARDKLLTLLHRATAELRDPGQAVETRIERAVEVLQRIVQSTEEGAPSAAARLGGLAPWRIRRLETFVNDNISEPIFIADMAAVVRLSPHHFCRAFRISLRQSPHDYVLRCRVLRAEHLMRTTAMPLGQIAVDCGFADQAHFTKVFRKLGGASPGAWRRREAERFVDVELAVHGGAPVPSYCKPRV
jgi:transcriptional regulator GlxA family with amidase domain